MTNNNEEIAKEDVPTPSSGQGMFSGWRLILMILCGGLLAKTGYNTFVKLRDSRERAEMIRCRNSLKNLGLASRIFAVDHNGRYPASWIEITNEFGSGRIFFCSLAPSGYVPGQSMEEAINRATYVYRGAGAVEGEAGRVVTFCPHHGHILMTDGEVLELERPLAEADFDSKDGKLYLRESWKGLERFQ